MDRRHLSWRVVMLQRYRYFFSQLKFSFHSLTLHSYCLLGQPDRLPFGSKLTRIYFFDRANLLGKLVVNEQTSCQCAYALQQSSTLPLVLISELIQLGVNDWTDALWAKLVYFFIYYCLLQSYTLLVKLNQAYIRLIVGSQLCLFSSIGIPNVSVWRTFLVLLTESAFWCLFTRQTGVNGRLSVSMMARQRVVSGEWTDMTRDA